MTDTTTTDPAPPTATSRTASAAPPPSAPAADPERYDSPRDVRARAKGLPGPYIEGGEDPNIDAALVEDRKLWRWLVAMVVTIIAAGFIIGLLLALAGPTSGA